MLETGLYRLLLCKVKCSQPCVHLLKWICFDIKTHAEVTFFYFPLSMLMRLMGAQWSFERDENGLSQMSVSSFVI